LRTAYFLDLMPAFGQMFAYRLLLDF